MRGSAGWRRVGMIGLLALLGLGLVATAWARRGKPRLPRRPTVKQIKQDVGLKDLTGIKLREGAKTSVLNGFTHYRRAVVLYEQFTNSG